MTTEAEKRDQALALFETHRPLILAGARAMAVSLAKKNGSVTSPEVLSALRADPVFGWVIDHVDRRFMGSVFARKGWTKLGMRYEGSHRRPVAVWTLDPGARGSLSLRERELALDAHRAMWIPEVLARLTEEQRAAVVRLGEWLARSVKKEKANGS